MTDKKKKEDFLAMLNQCRGILYKICLLHTDRSRDSMDELYQDIVCNLWESYPLFAHASKPSTWVYRVALNTVYLHYRTHKRLPRFVTFDATLLENIADENNNSVIEALYALRDRLDPEEKTLVNLYIDHVPYREIAELLETTEDAVKHRMARIKQKLKQMNKHGNE